MTCVNFWPFRLRRCATIKPAEFKKGLATDLGTVQLFHLPALESVGPGPVSRLPYSIRILLESALRNIDGFHVTEDDVHKILSWDPASPARTEIAFKPARVLLQDFTGVPAIVDLAAMRSAMERLGKDYRRIDVKVPSDLVVDHSVQVDVFGSKSAFAANVSREFERNRERYELLKWAQGAFKNLRVVPPATGIVHQVNLEYLARGVFTERVDGETIAYPDSLVGTDSHTTMINGMGILGWGVGGIEAEAVMLGEPIYIVLPEVIGFELKGRLKEGVTATDLVLTITEILRRKGVVGKFVEYYGDGLAALSLPDRATIGNMAPEYGATVGFFPVDDETLRYYRLTGRDAKVVDLIERYSKTQGLFHEKGSPEPRYSDRVKLDLAEVEPSLAGPRRPQDRVTLADLKRKFRAALSAPVGEGGFGISADRVSKTVSIALGEPETLAHGSTVIAAITSCTNTSNPTVMIGAALLAKKAVERGLCVRAHVKTSLAPGSRVVTEYLEKSGLDKYLDKLGFQTVAYGCTTCIGNSGPLPEPVEAAIKEGNLIAAAVLSGNRNFDGRIHPLCRASYLASPPLVVAYAIAGTVNIDLASEPLGRDGEGNGVYLRDIWPKEKEIRDVIDRVVNAKAFRAKYKDVLKGTDDWNEIRVASSTLYPWDTENAYIQEPPFFHDIEKPPPSIGPIRRARVLVMLGDSVTTDHISPAGSISADSPAGKYLVELGIRPQDFNSYGSRRGNHQVMIRGTFANVRLRNRLVPESEGPWTVLLPEMKKMSIYDASLEYRGAGVPLIVLAGKEYGSGSSRDWAAKGTSLLGVRVVLAESFERIHRSNLVGMGVLPLEFRGGDSRERLELRGDEEFDFEGLSDGLKPGDFVRVTATQKDGSKIHFEAKARIDTPVEVEYYRNGGILQTVLRRMADDRR